MFFARGISPGQKLWQTLLARGISCSQWEDPSMYSRCLAFFSFWSLGERRGEREGFFFSFFPHSQCVPTMFPSSSQWVPITRRPSLLGPLNTWAHWLYSPSPWGNKMNALVDSSWPKKLPWVGLLSLAGEFLSSGHRVKLDGGLTSKFLWTNLYSFEANWILEWDTNLHLGSSNHKLSVLTYFPLVRTNWFSLQNGAVLV